MMFINAFWKVILWLIIITALSLLPGDSVKEATLFNLPHIDKIAHFVMYTILSFLLFQAYQLYKINPNRLGIVLITLITLAIYGGLLELLQHKYITSRNADIYDFLFNTTGCIFGLAGFEVCRYFRKPRSV